MNEETRANLHKAITEYNAKCGDPDDRVNVNDALMEIGSEDNEEVEKAIEILRSKTENGE